MTGLQHWHSGSISGPAPFCANVTFVVRGLTFNAYEGQRPTGRAQSADDTDSLLIVWKVNRRKKEPDDRFSKYHSKCLFKHDLRTEAISPATFLSLTFSGFPLKLSANLNQISLKLENRKCAVSPLRQPAGGAVSLTQKKKAAQPEDTNKEPNYVNVEENNIPIQQ